MNKKIAQHNRLVYSAESQRHVVEQIDGLYWRDVLSQGLPIGRAETCVRKGVDFTEHDRKEEGQGGVNGLPESWEDVLVEEGRARKRRRTVRNDEQETQPGSIDREQEGEAPEEEDEEALEQQQQDEELAQKYAQLRQRLLVQHAQRKQLQRKVAQLKKLESLLKPFEKPQENIQPNLVTRDNKALEAEMSKMRVLLARVGNAVQAREVEAVEIQNPGRQETINTVSHVAKLEDVLAL